MHNYKSVHIHKITFKGKVVTRCFKISIFHDIISILFKFILFQMSSYFTCTFVPK